MSYSTYPRVHVYTGSAERFIQDCMQVQRDRMALAISTPADDTVWSPGDAECYIQDCISAERARADKAKSTLPPARRQVADTPFDTCIC